ncbi:MAG TPA: thioredoxin domain-containing protein, partial [Rugosibacter sp.]|nr:thioredoxin domain-containing protein [Rugosibacter sp.]
WQREEVRSLLSEQEFVLLSPIYGLDRKANFEGKTWHFYVAVSPEDSELAMFEQARAKLFLAREKRARPSRDDKILTSWNALAIKGLAAAGRALSRRDYIEMAQAAIDFIRNTMWHNGLLFATYKDGKAHLNAYLDDYAFLLDALFELMQADFREIDLDFARRIADALLENFQSENGGFYFTSHQHESLIHRPMQPYDNATPNGNGIAAVVLQRLGHLLGESRYMHATERALAVFDRHIRNNPAGCASLCFALREHLDPPSLAIVRGEDVQMQIWRKHLDACFSPHSLLFYLGKNLTELPETLDKEFSSDVNAWVCQGVNCLPKINDLKELLKIVA